MGSFERLAVGRRLAWHRRRLARPLNRAAVWVLGVGSCVAFVVSGTGGKPRFDLWAAISVQTGVLALTWRLWRAPEADLPAPLRLRSRIRRAGWRAATVLVLGASVALIVYGYGTGHHLPGLVRSARGVGGWLLALAPLPPLTGAAVWRLLPRTLRQAARSARTAEEIARTWQPYVATPVSSLVRAPVTNLVGFDPNLGAVGRPVPLRTAEPRGGLGPNCAVRPMRHAVEHWNATVPTRYEYSDAQISRWIRHACIDWDGHRLLFVDGRRNQAEVRIPGRSVELVWSIERTTRDNLICTDDVLLLLDAEGMRRLSMPALGMSESSVAELATAAGLRFAVHDLGRPAVERRPHPLSRRVYPPRKDCVRLSV